ncbi:hypothetical protein Scani_05810 [Streptomyces caniferus]|uniref:Uncharacterized protein n=1 Tax=Streptomyces caniferus TaxID=285557 RepID=A0A640RYN3_9ACTN|nr:hypothetical protein Scani_05810 [Streptomyces caniferus]
MTGWVAVDHEATRDPPRADARARHGAGRLAPQSAGGPRRQPSRARHAVTTRLPNRHCGLRAAGCGLRAAGCGLRAAGCGLRAAGCGLRAAGCGLRAAGCGLRAAGCGLRGQRVFWVVEVGRGEGWGRGAGPLGEAPSSVRVSLSRGPLGAPSRPPLP